LLGRQQLSRPKQSGATSKPPSELSESGVQPASTRSVATTPAGGHDDATVSPACDAVLPRPAKRGGGKASSISDYAPADDDPRARFSRARTRYCAARRTLRYGSVIGHLGLQATCTIAPHASCPSRQGQMATRRPPSRTSPSRHARTGATGRYGREGLPGAGPDSGAHGRRRARPGGRHQRSNADKTGVAPYGKKQGGRREYPGRPPWRSARHGPWSIVKV
jgi:hypothetical protein